MSKMQTLSDFSGAGTTNCSIHHKKRDWFRKLTPKSRSKWNFFSSENHI
jgi:hypothetical protein